MSFVQETFNPAKYLPVVITREGMEVLESELDKNRNGDSMWVEIGACEESTYENVCTVLKEHFQDVFTKALEEECEFIAFSC